MNKVDIVHPKTGAVIGFYMNDDTGPQYKRYKWSEFMDKLQGSNKARLIRAEMRTASNKAYDLEQFFDLARARGSVDFSDDFNRSVINSLVPDIVTRAQADNFMGVV